MKQFNLWKSVLLVLAFLGIFAFGQVFFQSQPLQVQAQDIDDVLDSFSNDFGFSNKENLKEENLQTANEQNREDEQIRLEEERKKTTQTQGTSTVTTADVTIVFNETTVGTPFTITITPMLGPVNPTPILIPNGGSGSVTFNSVPLGANTLNIFCSTSCAVNLSSIVNATCTTTSFTIPSSTIPGTTSCTVTASASPS